jgi:hypothetical protein
MASYSITIGNTFNVFGGSKVNRWGDSYGSNTTLTWQSAGLATFQNFWGPQEDLEINVIKGISNSLDMSSTVSENNVTKFIGNTLDMTSTVGKRQTRFFSNQMAFSTLFTTLTVKNGDWDLVFPDGTTNAADRYEPSWTETAQSSASWTETAQTTTSWTEV